MNSGLTRILAYALAVLLVHSSAYGEKLPVHPRFCDSDMPEHVSKAQCSELGGEALHASCRGCGEMCVLKKPDSPSVAFKNLREYQQKFVEHMPLRFVDGGNNALKIDLAYPSGKLSEDGFSSSISGPAVVAGNNKGNFHYSWYLNGLQLEVRRCKPFEENKYRCCSIYLSIDDDLPSNLKISGKSIESGIRYEVPKKQAAPK